MHKLVSIYFISILMLGTYEVGAQHFFKRKPKPSAARNNAETEYVFIEAINEFNLGRYNKALPLFEACLKRDPQNATLYFKISNTLAKLGKYDLAINFGQKAVELNPENKYFYILLAELYEQKKMYKQGAEVLEKMLAKNMHADEYYFQLAGFYLQLQKIDDAIDVLNKAEKIYGVSEEFTLQKQQLYLKLNKIEMVQEEGRKLVKAFPNENKYKLQLAEILFNNELVSQATDLVDTVLTNDPNEPLAFLILSDIARSKGEHEKAENHLVHAFESPRLSIEDKIEIITDLVNLARDIEDKEFVLKLAQTIVNTHPEEASGYAILADMYLFNSKNKEALISYKKSTKISSDNFKVWAQILAIEAEQNIIDSLLIDSEKAISFFPNNAIFWYHNGNALASKKNYKNAISSFQQAVDLSSEEQNLQLQSLARLGDIYNEIKDYSNSDLSFEKALKIDAKNYYVLNNYSYFLSLRKAKLDIAKEMSLKVVEANPDDANYLDTYAWVLFQAKDYEKAKELLEKAAFKSNNGAIIEHYGDVLFKLGKKDDALANWKKALQLGDTSDFLPKKIQDKQLYE